MKRPPLVRLVEREDGVLEAAYRWRRYRVLLGDGRVVEVAAVRADTYLSDAIMEWAGCDRIAGMTELGPDETTET